MPKIYESPDSGKTVYEREFGEVRSYYTGPSRFPAFPYLSIPEIVDMFDDAEENESLKKLLEQAIILYKIKK